ncbi:MAG: HD-GYP domain-containing protein [Gemmatimonadetes bacterium]|nr:HD-GYP domain-containing protein [Gemmatimonadota bacterium]
MYTAGHSIRVGVLGTAMARELGLTPEEVRLVRLGGLLHDIGKVQVPAALLEKPESLTHEEYCRVMAHTTFGARILAPLRTRYPTILGIVRWHHERVDGRGLPDGLEGDAIPLGARIVAVADAFDAMTTARPYRRLAFSPAEALLELERGAGTQFDTRCVRALQVGWSAAFAMIGEAGSASGTGQVGRLAAFVAPRAPVRSTPVGRLVPQSN